MLETSVYAKRHGVDGSTVRRWIRLALAVELAPGELRELRDESERKWLPGVEAVERTPGGHYRLRVKEARA